jgi:hypothetical protein
MKHLGCRFAAKVQQIEYRGIRLRMGRASRLRLVGMVGEHFRGVEGGACLCELGCEML